MKSDLSVEGEVYSGILNEDEPTAAGHACNVRWTSRNASLCPERNEAV